MRHIRLYRLIFIAALPFASSCVYDYVAEVKGGAETLVVEGDIMIGDLSKFVLSNSLLLNSSEKITSLEAESLFVECEDGSILQSEYNEEVDASFVNSKKRTYVVNTVNADPTKKYRLRITLDGKGDMTNVYSTDFLEVYQTPPIDSVYFIPNRDSTVISIFVNTHSDDPSFKNFMWTYLEDWEVRAHIDAKYYYDSDLDTVLRMTDYDNQNRYYCWQRHISSEIIIENTDLLTENVILGKKIKEVSNESIRLSRLYSIEVSQKALSDASYKYWNNVFKNNDKMGGIFSPQPNEIKGNIFCENDNTVTVVGYINAATIQKARIFINARKLGLYRPPKHYCKEEIENDPEKWRRMYSKGYDIGYYDSQSGNYSWYDRGCVDCREYGTKNRPDFWPTVY